MSFASASSSLPRRPSSSSSMRSCHQPRHSWAASMKNIRMRMVSCTSRVLFPLFRPLGHVLTAVQILWREHFRWLLSINGSFLANGILRTVKVFDSRTYVSSSCRSRLIHDELDGLLGLCGGISHLRRRYIGCATISFTSFNGLYWRTSYGFDGFWWMNYLMILGWLHTFYSIRCFE